MALPAGRKGVLPSELTPEGKINFPEIPTELPSYSSSDEGKVLTVDSNGKLKWETKGSGGTTTITPIAKSAFPYTATEAGFVYIFAVGSTVSASTAYYENIKLNNVNLLYGNTYGTAFNNKPVSLTIPVNVGDVVSLDGNDKWSEFNAMFIKN